MMTNKKTLILGASTNTTRYAHVAAHRLQANGHTIINVGLKTGNVAGVAIEKPDVIHAGVDTITLYISVPNQLPLYNYILKTNPKRLIFNPGTENPELQQLARAQGIETEFACTLVLLSTGQY